MAKKPTKSTNSKKNIKPPMSAPSKKKADEDIDPDADAFGEPTAEERAEIFAENRERFSIAHQIAKEVFKTDRPLIEQTTAVCDALKSGVERDLVPAVFGEAIEHLARLGAPDVSKLAPTQPVEAVEKVLVEHADLTRDLASILLDDEQSEDHLKDAELRAREMFGEAASASTILDVYYELYGLDHVFGEP